MLALRPNCECCDVDLPPESAAAMICSFECTFCADCAGTVLKGACPNCGGDWCAADPPRGKARGYPASTLRVQRDAPCPSAA